MNLQEYGEKLRRELLADKSEITIAEIAKRINGLKVNGIPISEQQKIKLLEYIKYEHTSDGKIILKESDNSSWIKATKLLKQKIENGNS